MKILWLYKYLSWYNFDKWLHMEFVKSLKKYPGVDVLSYGPDLHIGYPELATVAFNPNMTMADIKRIFPYDVVIVNTKSRAFMEYSPHQNIRRNCWLPHGFDRVPEPKVMIEEDYHYEPDDNWYADVKFDLLIQRHYSSFMRKGLVPNAWLPFSVDTSVFHPDESIPRHQKIGFVGSLGSSAYPDRGIAIGTLFQHNYVHNLQKVVDDMYVKVLKQYVCFLSCSSLYDITASKNFEIMASGSVLLTDKFSGINELFPEGTCVRFDKSQFDLVDMAKKILNDQAYARDVANKGIIHISQHHTHEVRIGQLLTILKNINK